jgi:serine/threonine protein kinase
MAPETKKQNTESFFKDLRDSLGMKPRNKDTKSPKIPDDASGINSTASIFSDLKVLTQKDDDQELKFGLLGKQIGSFQVESIIGEGGFSTIYKVRDKTLGVYRALKLFKLNPIDPMSKDDLERLKKEARIATFLQHQHICKVHALDYIVHPQHEELKIPYIVMDYVEADSLRSLMKDSTHKLPEVFSLAVFIQCAEALNYAYQNSVSFVDEQSGIAVESQYRHITHRDLKPENILVNKNGALIIDFGIATTFMDMPGTISVKGFYMGTPAYMAPEIIRGVQVSPEKSFKGDLYGLCVVLYEMVEHTLPFVADEKTDIITKVNRQQYPKPKCNPKIARIIQKGMAQKYASYDEAIQDAYKTLSRYNTMNPSQVIRRLFDTRENGEEIEKAFREFQFQASKKPEERKKENSRRGLFIILLVLAGIAVLAGGFIFRLYRSGTTENPPLKEPETKKEEIVLNVQPGTEKENSFNSEILQNSSEIPPVPAQRSNVKSAPIATELSAEDLYAEAKNEIAAGEFDRAFETLERIKDPASDYLRVLIFMKKEDYFSALKSYEHIAGSSTLEPYEIRDLGYYESAVCYSNLYFQRKRDKYKDEALSRFLDLRDHYQTKIPPELYARIDSRIQLLNETGE